MVKVRMVKIRMHCLISIIIILVKVLAVLSLKEFSLARYPSLTVYPNNSDINIRLVGEGYPGVRLTSGGALECHTDDTTCCRGIHDPNGNGKGEWYYPDGTVVPRPNSGNSFYRTRDHMVIRLNRRPDILSPTGTYTCVIPGTGGVNITRYITLGASTDQCEDLSSIMNGRDIVYIPAVPTPAGQRYVGTIAIYTCSSGYLLMGGSMRACIEGMWNGIEPTCANIPCPGIPDPTNGKVSFNNLTATYTCNTGYILNGTMTRTCGESGTWSLSAPTCDIPCPGIPSPTNGRVSINYLTATYTCNRGYIMNGAMTRTCEEDGTWSLSAPTCVAIPCSISEIDSPTNGKVSIHGLAAIYTCNPGYILNGPMKRTCGESRTWSLSAPTCDIPCPGIPSPTNGRVSINALITATYTCNPGYILSGTERRTCRNDGTWSLSAPTCVAIPCSISEIDSPTNGKVSIHGLTVTYTCNTGYILKGEMTRTCGESRIWSLSAPTCDIPCPGIPSPTNGKVSFNGLTATYTCNRGYIMNGAMTRTCGESRTWSLSAPTCVAIPCSISEIDSPTNGKVSIYGLTVTYTCNPGYILNGPMTRTCGESGTWSLSAPTCDESIPTTLPPTSATNPSTSHIPPTTRQPTSDASSSAHPNTHTSPTGGPPSTNTTPPKSPTPHTNTAIQVSTSATINTESVAIGVTAVVCIIILLVIIALLLVYIMSLKKQLKLSQFNISGVNPVETVQYETVTGVTKSKEGRSCDTEYEGVGGMYEEVDKLREPHPPKGDYELSQCAAYGSVVH